MQYSSRKPGTRGDAMKITNSIWKITEELYTNFDRGLIDYIRKTPEFIADVEKAMPESRKIYILQFGTKSAIWT
jgi:hypothetical protein